MGFSAGPRSCIGKNLALVEMRVMMIKILLRYEKVVELGMKDRSYEMPFTVHVKNCEADLVKKRMM